MIDYEFLESLEGFELDGYVPDPEGSHSGVTLASGVDLGQRSAADLTKMGLPEVLCDRLAPYCGLKSEDAVRALEDSPVNISETDARALNEAAKSSSLASLKAAWNATSNIDWDDLDDVKQTVVASVAYQYGSLSAKCPNFWRQTTTGAWDEAYDNLMQFGDSYQTRRHKEAAYLQSA